MEAGLKQLANEAAAGDGRAIKLLLELAAKVRDPETFGQTVQSDHWAFCPGGALMAPPSGKERESGTAAP
jgi:hypothetical protein